MIKRLKKRDEKKKMSLEDGGGGFAGEGKRDVGQGKKRREWHARGKNGCRKEGNPMCGRR